jgi:prepilin-type N-terminal cleavage/methylation domain-containing protein
MTMNKFILRSKNAFTLQEVAVVVIIVGVLAALALPRFSFQVEKMKKAEGEQILYVVYMEQEKYFRRNGARTNSIANLDVEIRQPANFNAPVLKATVSLSCDGSSSDAYASIARSDGSYNLHVTDNGVIRCTPCNGQMCSKLGYPTF